MPYWSVWVLDSYTQGKLLLAACVECPRGVDDPVCTVHEEGRTLAVSCHGKGHDCVLTLVGIGCLQ